MLKCCSFCPFKDISIVSIGGHIGWRAYTIDIRYDVEMRTGHPMTIPSSPAKGYYSSSLLFLCRVTWIFMVMDAEITSTNQNAWYNNVFCRKNGYKTVTCS
jgi:hypothetical protein